MAAAAAVCIGVMAMCASAGADAVTGPESKPGPIGLPDGRLYEEVTPPNKYGNEVRIDRPMFASQDGDAAMYGANGALAENSSNGALIPEMASERTGHGWVTRSTMPLPVVGKTFDEEYVATFTGPTLLTPSSDLSHLLFGTWGHEPYVSGAVAKLANNIYVEGPDPTAEPVWAGRPQIEPTGAGYYSVVAGASPDLKTVYFTYEGQLLSKASELYEYRDGALSDAGALPGAEVSADKALPAAQPNGTGGEEGSIVSPAAFDNQVSADGSRIFFIRKDEAGSLELYAHITDPDGTQRVVLVSQSQLAEHVGQPAPSGPIAVPATVWAVNNPLIVEGGGQMNTPSYVFASPDGSHAFFQSRDRLTTAAPENGEPKTYDFDLETGGLEYLPGLVGSIVTVSRDGSSLLFENTASSPFRLDRWVAGPSGGTVVSIAELPSVSRNACGAVLCVGPAYSSQDGKVFLFETESPIPGFNDNGSHYQRKFIVEGEAPEPGPENLWPNMEAFRYDVEGNELRCISCPPEGVVPSSNAIVSPLATTSNSPGSTGWSEVLTSGTPMSADGDRMFFETRDPLVPQDTNGTGDVYEWNNGTLYLISSGHSSKRSLFAAVSESGGDVFFATAEGILPGDRDGGFDIYDARIPRPGDNPPPEAIPCEGAVCQGPPSVPNLLGQPASEAFSGAGDAVISAQEHVSPKSLTKAQKLARALSKCRRKRNGSQRRRCKSRAWHKYGAQAVRSRAGATRASHGNGRGN